MKKTSRQHFFLLFLCFFGGVGLALGCSSLAGTLAYIVKGEDVDPPCRALQGRVAIVCRPRASASYQYGSAAAQISRSVNSHITKKLPKKVELIPQREIEDHCDGLDSELEFEDIGLAVDADQVIAIDLHDYSYTEGHGMYRGKAQITIRLIDVKSGNVIYNAIGCNAHVWPENGCWTASETINDNTFQQYYFYDLGYCISKNFIPYSRFDEVRIAAPQR